MAPGAHAAAQIISTDPYTSGGGAHASEVEPFAAASGNTIVSGFQVGRYNLAGGGSTNIGWATSTDNGQTWTHGLMPSLTVDSSPPGSWSRVVDPGAAYDAAHDTWLVWSVAMAQSGSNFLNAAMVVNRSSDGVNWSAPVVISAANSPDKDWIVCDNWVSSPNRGTCYAVWSNNSLGDLVTMSRSTDGGQTWSAPVATANNQAGYNVQPVVQPTGTVVVVLTLAHLNTLGAFKSTNGGASWGAPVSFDTLTAHTPVNGLRAIAKPAVTVDGNGTIYAIWPDCRFRSNCSANDIVFSTSTDALTWSPTVQIPIDPTSSPVDHFLAGIGADPATSGSSARLGLVYYYFANSAWCATGVPACALYAAFVSSVDGGATWSSHGTSNATAMRPYWLPPTSRGTMLGDYFPVVWSGGKAVPIFPLARVNSGTVYDETMSTVLQTPPAPSAPVISIVPLAAGTAQVGNSLFVGIGNWSGKLPISYTYQWQRCSSAGTNCVAIAGATSPTYPLVNADAGFTVRAVLTAQNSLGSASSNSNLSVVVKAIPANTAPPTISGTAAAGATLTASKGTWTGSPTPTFTYQWQRCDSAGANCVNIAGATATTYPVVSADAGSTLVVVVTGTNSVGSSSTGSAATAVVTAPPANTSAPTVSGSPAPGNTLTAAPGTWTGYPAPTFGYQWRRCDSGGANCADIASATSSTYTVVGADVGSTLLVLVTGTNSAGSASASSAATAVVTAPPMNTSPPTIAGSAVQGQTLTASQGTWTGSPAPTFAYQWQRCDAAGANCAAIASATATTYAVAAADLSSTLVVVVTGTNSGGSSSTSSAATVVVTGPPMNNSAPTVSGSADQGQTLTASPGSWSGSPAPTFSYQWQRCDSGGANCAGIGGATSLTYLVVAADAASTLVVVVTGTNSAGSSSATSAATAVVTAAPANTSAPTVSGSPMPGSTLTAAPGTWTGYPAPAFTYQWRRCDSGGANCGDIATATASTYAPVGADVGSTLVVVVTGANSAGSSSASSAATGVVTAPPMNNSTPTVSGPAVVGQTLTAAPGSWSGSPAPTFSYQWQRCDSGGANCANISGETSLTYAVAAADAGSTLVVVVTGTNSSGSSSASSAATAVVTAPPANTSAPTISGSAAPGQTLTASPGTWSGSPAPSFTYQWRRCNSSGTGCADIVGATATTYVLAAADAGSTLVVVVTGTNGAGSSSATSAATAVVSAPPMNTTAPTISGSAVEGQTLTASPGTWSGSPAPTFAYQWQRCNASGGSCANITGSTATTRSVLAADVGATLVVVVTGTNTAGSASASSAATAVVTSAPGPVTSLLDDFNRANNGGPPGPNWTHMVVSSTAASNNLLITGQQVTGLANSNADYWNAAQYGPDSEVWLTVATKPSVDNDPVVLGLRFQNPDLATASGYQAYYINRSPGTDQYRISVRVNGTGGSTLSSVTGPELNPGDKLLFRAIGPALELWRFDGSVWTRILTATDGSYTGAGYLIVTTRNTAVRLDNFGGGTLP